MGWFIYVEFFKGIVKPEKRGVKSGQEWHISNCHDFKLQENLFSIYSQKKGASILIG
jgi:hypothetical protein